MTISEGAITIGSILSGLAAFGSGILYTRRRLSRDGVELKKDRAEIDIIETLTLQRDEASATVRELRAQNAQAELDRQVAVERASQLENELRQLRARVTLLKELVSRLSSALDLTRSQLDAISRMPHHHVTPPPTDTSGSDS